MDSLRQRLRRAAVLMGSLLPALAWPQAGDLRGARPTVADGGLRWQGEPVYLVGVWVGTSVSTDPRLYKPDLDGDHPAYASLLSAVTASGLGINSAHPPMSPYRVAQTTGWLPEGRDDQARYERLQSFVKGLGDMPVTVDCAGISAFGSEKVPAGVRQVGPGWHGFVPLCPDSPEGLAVYQAYWRDCARQIVEAGSNAVIYELFNEPAYNCRCRHNTRRFAERMAARYGTITAANRVWHTRFADFAAVAALPAPDETPGLWCDWCAFIGDRYVELLQAGKQAIMQGDRRPLLFLDQPSIGSTYLRCNGIDPVKVNALMDIVGMEGGVRFGASTPRAEADPMAAVHAAGDLFSHQLFLDMARAFGKPIVNTETYCGRFYANVRFPSRRQDLCTELWTEMLHGASGSYFYNWGRRWWEWRDPEGAKRAARETGYKAYSMLNPYAYPAAALRGLQDFVADMSRVGAELLDGPRLQGQVALLISQPTIRQVFRGRSYTEAGPYEKGVRAWYGALVLAQIPVDVLWEEQLPSRDVSAYRALLAPGADYLYRASEAPLRAFVAAGGRVVATPEAMSKDEYGEPWQPRGGMDLAVTRIDASLTGPALGTALRDALLAPRDDRAFTVVPADDPARPLQCEAYRVVRGPRQYVCLVNWETTSRLVRLRVPGARPGALLAPLDEAVYAEGDPAGEGVLLHLPAQVRTLVLMAPAGSGGGTTWAEADIRAAYARALTAETEELASAQAELAADRAATEQLRVSLGGPTTAAGEYATDAATVCLLHLNGSLDRPPATRAGTLDFTGGKFDTQALHTGADARLQFALPADYAPGTGTLECWARPDWPTADGQRHTLVELKGPGDWNQNRVMIYKNLDHEVAFVAYDQDHRALVVRAPINVLRQGQWTHLAGTWEAAAGLRFYVNGQAVGKADGPVRLGTLDRLTLGNASDSDRPWSGTIDEVRLSSTARQQP